MGKKKNKGKPVVSKHQIDKMELEKKNARLGFFLFLLGELILFGVLFDKYNELGNQILKGPTPQEIFPIYLAVFATFILLISNFTCFQAMKAATDNNEYLVKRWFTITISLGIIFLGILGIEMREYISQPISPFITIFNSILTLHGLHVVFGVFWLIYLQMRLKRDKNLFSFPRFYMISYYWTFNVIFGVIIYTLVYVIKDIAI